MKIASSPTNVPPGNASHDATKSPIRRRQVLFRLIAVCLGLSPLLLMECACRIGGWGAPNDVGDPFVGFSEMRPLFVLGDEQDRYEIPPSRQGFFQPDSFSAHKPSDEFRVFCLGGSTVQGRPYSIETSFTTWLELSLRAADPSRRWEVVNCGGVSYASYRLVPIMKEVLNYDPDLIIVYTGHNEFLENRTYGHIKNRPAWLKATHEWLTNLRTYGVCQSLWTRFARPDVKRGSQDRTTLAAEVDALLDYQGGLETYHRDDQWRRGVIAHFEVNLRRMSRIASQAGVPLILVNPVSNLRDTPPFKSAHTGSLSADKLAEFERLWDQAKSLDWRHLDSKVKLLRQALEIDPRYADAHFLLAKCYDAQRLSQKARLAYLRAKDEDICPLRILEPMHEALRAVTHQTRTPLVDVRRLFQRLSEDGIPGDDCLIDHVHPRIEGHQQIAEALIEEMLRLEFVSAQPQWKTRRKTLYVDQLERLEPSYFPQSVARLRGLRRWTQGRVTRVGLPRGALETDQGTLKGGASPPAH